MEIFFSSETAGAKCVLHKEEAFHCVKVLRHKEGDELFVTDGKGFLYRCAFMGLADGRAECRILETFPVWGSHPYELTLAVCPTKNNDRFEWFAEKATEIGLDRLVPLIGERSERRVFKTERLSRIVVSAMKQSLKALLPEISEPVSVKDFIYSQKDDNEALKLIAHCSEGEKLSIKEALERFNGRRLTVMIGPEGDFSPEEVEAALSCGFIPVHLGNSRLRTETAGVAAASAVYFRYM